MQMCVAEQNNNGHHNNMQHNADVSQEINNSIYMDGLEIVDDYDATTTKVDNDQKECDDRRKEGEPPIICKVDDTDVGDVWRYQSSILFQ